MTLKEKFENNITGVAGQVYIADEFAIGFAEWCQYDMPIEYFSYYTSKELLEIYKKEKGL